MELFHIYVGTKYQGPVRADNKHQAVMLYAERAHKSPLIFHAKPAGRVQDLKQPKESAKPFYPEY